MGNALTAAAANRLFLSGNDAVAHAARDAGVRVAAAYPGTPSTEILEVLARFPGLYAEWSPNEKVALEVALGASMMGARAFSAMKHVGLNVASDALMTMTVTGASMLWVGWFGFNAGSAVAVNGDAGMAMLVTHIAAAAGSLSWMAIEWFKHGKPSVLGIVTGMVAGLGTITPASGVAGPLGALMIGLTAGVVCYFSTQLVKRVLRIDDSLDVFPVHGVGGILGSLLAGVVVSAEFGGKGLAEGVTLGQQISVQLTGIVSVALYCGVLTFVLLKVTQALVGLRVTAETETEGLDLGEHDERGYNI